MFRKWDVGDVGCWGRVIFGTRVLGMWDFRDMGCGIGDVY